MSSKRLSIGLPERFLAGQIVLLLTLILLIVL
ncbi:hypothetical protein SAMN05444380_10953 [Thermophagus xiamenensis]|uniref:Uncharacterized protein n=1 Tax=Thermophagus xiamenensis TaxID=385682 RepID=A0A1I1ZBA2_9BACT|nr:hypothetical protein SAMN05444380_10953 [Thermophagus xiamenensis]